MTLPTSASLKFGAIACASAAVIGLVWWRQTSSAFTGRRATDADHAAIQAAATAAQSSLAQQVSASNLIENPDAPTRKDVEILEFLTRQSPLVLFIKGDASKQRCKFSRRLIELLPAVLGQPLAARAEAGQGSESLASAPHTAEWLAARGIVCVDILADSSLRTGLKTFAEWPSYPMVQCAPCANE